MTTVKTLKAPDRELFSICMSAARLSHRSTGDDGGQKDIELAKKLIKDGDEHAKAIRGMLVYAEIDAPRYFWQEMNTYTVGVEPLGSESTMHDRPKLSGEELVEYKFNLP